VSNGVVDIPAGPVADRLSVWPLDDGTYGLDATFQGASGYERAAQYEDFLTDLPIKWSLRQELDGGWTLRFSPISAEQVSVALSAFVH